MDVCAQATIVGAMYYSKSLNSAEKYKKTLHYVKLHYASNLKMLKIHAKHYANLGYSLKPHYNLNPHQAKDLLQKLVCIADPEKYSNLYSTATILIFIYLFHWLGSMRNSAAFLALSRSVSCMVVFPAFKSAKANIFKSFESSIAVS